jgi:hypothetical protein
MRVNYQPLNEAQLHRLLQGYNLGGKSPPYSWSPPPEDRHQALQEGRFRRKRENIREFRLCLQCF